MAYRKNMRKIEKTDVYLPEGSNRSDLTGAASWLVAKPCQREVPIDIMPGYILVQPAL
ncbi:MAG: hypothetical protein ACLUVG_01500 [Phocaeicola vulgatus]